jgi:Protein of unknown function (DUF1592)/Protein of unknown function (DUF1588)/Protein of unknown function (DUF1585)/Protein of unknown function (DUF1595)/Protein of unknown function (DUF1587)
VKLGLNVVKGSVVVVSLALGLACTGRIGRGGGASAAAGAGGAAGAPVPSKGDPNLPSSWTPGAPAGDPTAAPRMPLRRLTRVEYNHVVRDLLGDSSQPADAFSEPIAGSSGFATSGIVGEVDVVAYQQAAEALAASVDIRTLSACDPATSSEQGCAEQFVATFGRRAFRRPLSSTELADFVSLYANDLRKTAGLDHEGALRGVLEAMLQDVPFLYHWELGAVAPKAVAGVVALSPFELASRLSFFLWSSMPDAPLLAAAENGSLTDPAVLEAQARRLLADPKSADTTRGFYLQWLEISVKGAAKSPDLYPTFNPALAQNMEDEVVQFAQSITRDPKAGLQELLTSNRGFVNTALGTLYGVAGAGADLSPTTLDPVQRPGILARAGFLTMTSNAYEGDPTKRGSVIRRRVLCQSLAPPPANVPTLPPPAPDATVRERHAAHIMLNPCNACHRLTDLIGFGFGNYDAIGRFQTLESGKSIDPSGTIVALDGGDHDFAGPAALMPLLASSAEVQTCVTKQWLRFAFDRLETVADDASLQQIFDRFQGSHYNFTELLVALAKSRSFSYRAPSAGEVTQ